MLDATDDRKYAVRNVADLASAWDFISEDKPDQWICWDFRAMRVRPTHYTIKGQYLKSWIVDGSLDFVNWTEIDRKTNTTDFTRGFATALYAVSKSAECCFVRLTQTGKRHSSKYGYDHTTGKTHCAYDYLHVRAFEFFGTLLEWRE
jgi:hypothetical protein